MRSRRAATRARSRVRVPDRPRSPRRECAPNRRSGRRPHRGGLRRREARSAARAGACAAPRRSRASRGARSGRSHPRWYVAGGGEGQPDRGSIRSSAFAACWTRTSATRWATCSSTAREFARRGAPRCAPRRSRSRPSQRAPRWHLDHRVQGIGAAEGTAVQRHADDRLRGQRGEHPGQVGGQARRADEDPDARGLGLRDVGVECVGLPVSADDRCLPADAVLVEYVEAALDARQVGTGTAHDGDGRHGGRISGTGRPPIARLDAALSWMAHGVLQRSRTPPQEASRCHHRCRQPASESHCSSC